MTPHDDTYTQLIAIHHRSFAAADYETAYHALAAALHRAYWIHAAALLVAVHDLATAQTAHLAAHPPAEPPPVTRSLQSLFGALASIAAGRAHLLTLRHAAEPPPT